MRFVKKIKIMQTKKQKETFDFWLRRCKVIYNIALEEKIEAYKKLKKSISFYDQKKELVDIKEYDLSYKDVPNKCLTETLERLDKGFKKFFKQKEVGFPKFKNNSNFNSLFFVKDDVRLKDNKIYLPKIKEPIKLTEDIINSNWTSVRLVKENQDKYYLIFNYDDGKTLEYNKVNDLKLSSVGIDLGLKILLTDSNGYKIKRFNLKLIKRYVNRIVELNQSLSTKKKGSIKFKKVKKQLQTAYKRLKNTKDDYYKKEIFTYVNNLLKNNIEVISLGDIEVKKIVNKSEDKNVKSKRYLRRSFGNTGLGQFKDKLHSKCENKGIKVYRVKENYTSKACSCCGMVNDNLRLSDRVFKCINKECNKVIDRDLNGSINIQSVWQGQFKPFRLNSFNNKDFISLGNK